MFSKLITRICSYQTFFMHDETVYWLAYSPHHSITFIILDFGSLYRLFYKFNKLGAPSPIEFREKAAA
ncbi:hypothetical protein D3C74_82850 [compost metagenome]